MQVHTQTLQPSNRLSCVDMRPKFSTVCFDPSYMILQSGGDDCEDAQIYARDRSCMPATVDLQLETSHTNIDISKLNADDCLLSHAITCTMRFPARGAHTCLPLDRGAQ